MKDNTNSIKAKVKASGYHVHIINELNTGTSYEDLEADLKTKGCKLTAKELHDYHSTMTNYANSKQKKPVGENMTVRSDFGGYTDVSAVIEQIQQDKQTDVKTMVKMLHKLFCRQIAICFELQSQHLDDELVLMNNELKNLATIKAVYFDAVKIKEHEFNNYLK